LRKAHGELEQRVEERTAELAKANDQLKQEIEERKLAEKEREKLINELQKAIKEIKTLRGILPLCSFCKKIRDDKGYWEQVDVYIHKHLQADISHGICPACAKEHYPDLDIHE
jgi:DNA repair exonuclease SbcCD ATPase subunit